MNEQIEFPTNEIIGIETMIESLNREGTAGKIRKVLEGLLSFQKRCQEDGFEFEIDPDSAIKQDLSGGQWGHVLISLRPAAWFEKILIDMPDYNIDMRAPVVDILFSQEKIESDIPDAISAYSNAKRDLLAMFGAHVLNQMKSKKASDDGSKREKPIAINS